MSHLWKIDLYKVLMFPGCFREDLVAGGRHSSWGTKPFRRILSKTCLSFKKLKDSKKKKKKLQKSTKSKTQPSKFSQPFQPPTCALCLHPAAPRRCSFIPWHVTASAAGPSPGCWRSSVGRSKGTKEDQESWWFWGDFGGPHPRFLSENGGGGPECSNKINWGI